MSNPWTFTLTDEQAAKLEKWGAEQDAIVVERQRLKIATEGATDSFTAALAADGIPYYGAAGGQLTFSFCPTSLGTVETVKHSGTGAELDLTEYGQW